MRRAAGVAITVGVLAMMTAVVWGQDDEDTGPMSSMHFVVVRDNNGKPVKNAAVVLHPVTKKGKQAMGGLELKTDEEGKTAIDGIPYGPLRVQVLAPGFQTYGEDYLINKAQTEITIKLKRPSKQVTAYGVQESTKKTGDGQSGGNKPDGKTEQPQK
jgi:Carboxypeptidase regulatory-like domain